MKGLKWVSGAAVGVSMLLAGSSAFAVTIGFSQVGDEGDWRPAFSKDMQDEAKKEGIDLKFADAQGKQEEQLKAVRSFIAQGVDAIIIAPVVTTGWDQVLKEAKDVMREMHVDLILLIGHQHDDRDVCFFAVHTPDGWVDLHGQNLVVLKGYAIQGN